MLRRIARSLITRIVLAGLVLVAISFGFRLYVVAPALQADLSAQVESQQAALANYIAQDVETKLAARKALLERLAKQLPPVLLERPAQLDTWLAERHVLIPLFSKGMMLVSADGKRTLAESPRIAGRASLDFQGSDWVAAAKASHGVVFSRPFRGRLAGAPLLIMSVAIRSADGTPRAILAGVSRLDAPDFLDLSQNTKIGSSGGFLVVSPADKLIVAATDPALVLSPTPAAGVSPLHDRAMAGYRGAGIATGANGVEELAAIAGVPATGWFVVARQSTEEAFWPFLRMRKTMIRYGVIVTAVLLFVLLVVLPYIFRPLTSVAREMRAMAAGTRDLAPLPIVRHDEVGDVAAGFNALLYRLRDNEDKLRRSEAHMTHMAHHDPLTGLPNRLLLEDRLSQAIGRAERNGTGLALLFLDLDGFKPINDAHGHEVGDRVLCLVAERLLANRRRTDTVARIGGDEFVILLADVDLLNLHPLAEELAQANITLISQPYRLDALELALGTSIGIALYSASESVGAGHLLNRADLAMYAAKQAGKGRYLFFRTDMMKT